MQPLYTHANSVSPFAPAAQGGADPAAALRFQSSLLDAVGDALAATDLDGTIIYWNLAAERLFGWMQEEVLGHNILDVTPASLTANDAAEVLRSLTEGESWSGEFKLRRRDGSEFLGHVTDTPVLDEDGRLVAIIGVTKDITQEVEVRTKLLHLASHDSLTGLLNRRSLEARIDRSIAGANSASPCALVLLDIDWFKAINDSLGHRAGDEMLIRFADLLRETLPDQVVARYGGDEFAVLLPSGGAREAHEAAAMVASALRTRGHWNRGMRLPITVSAGIAVYPQHGETADELTSHADLALYDAKTSGRNRVSVYSDALVGRVQQLPARRYNRLCAAIEKERLELHCQPVLSGGDGSLMYHEMLLRLRNPNGKTVNAGSFIPFAEQTGLIPTIDRWVVKEAFRTAAELQARGHLAPVAMNLSRYAFSDPTMLAFIRMELMRSAVDPSLVIVEMTETSALQDTSAAGRFMDSLESLGCLIALDDFGVGYSSFQHLRRLPLDYLKIDGSYVRTLHRSRVDRGIVTAMVRLAQELGIVAIAENVSNARVLRILEEMGVDGVQGFYLQKPFPVRDLLDEAARTASSDRAA